MHYVLPKRGILYCFFFSVNIVVDILKYVYDNKCIGFVFCDTKKRWPSHYKTNEKYFVCQNEQTYTFNWPLFSADVKMVLFNSYYT